MADAIKLDYRAVSVDLPGLAEAIFRYRVKPMETEFLFQDGSVHVFPNWDVKNFRERFYVEEYVNISPEEYLRLSAESGDVVEYGITASDVRKFIGRRAEFFEDLLLASDTPLDSEENL
jgi:hypothetical protein